MKVTKRILAFFLALIMIAGLTLSGNAYNFGDWEYTISDGVVTITRYTGTAAAVSIPSTIEGLPVTKIGDNAFDICTTMTSITIPYTITHIGSWAFVGCTGLTSITIPDSVIFIDNAAFYNCVNLASVTLSNSITSIGGYTFVACHRLTSITIPDSVTSIGESAFNRCVGLTSVTIPKNVNSIGVDAFANTNSKLTISGYSNSYAEAYAKNNNIPFLAKDQPTDIITGNFNGHTYTVYELGMTWHEAKAYCEKLGGYLATITSKEEQDFITSIIKKGNKNYYWLGAECEKKWGDWKWVTGEKWDYTNWASGEPNNGAGVENYLMIYNIDPYNQYKWNDKSADDGIFGEFWHVKNSGFICEWGDYDKLNPNDEAPVIGKFELVSPPNPIYKGDTVTAYAAGLVNVTKIEFYTVDKNNKETLVSGSTTYDPGSAFKYQVTLNDVNILQIRAKAYNSAGVSVIADPIIVNVMEKILTKIEVMPTSFLTLDKGQSQSLSVKAIYSDKSTEDITSKATYKSSDTSIATVSGNKVTASSTKVGNCTITVTYQGITVDVSVTVSDTAPIIGKFEVPNLIKKGDIVVAKVTGLVNVTKIEFYTVKNNVETLVSGATQTNLFSSRDVPITLNDVNITKIKIKAYNSAGNFVEKEVTVTVIEVTKIDVTPYALALDKGQSQSLSVMATYSNNTTEDITSKATYKSSDTSIASVSGNKVIMSSTKAGECTITVTYQGITENVRVYVLEPKKPKIGEDTLTVDKVFNNSIILQLNSITMLANGKDKIVLRNMKSANEQDGCYYPAIIDGQTLVPLRCIIESLGGTVKWNNDDDIDVKLEEKSIKVGIKRTSSYVRKIDSIIYVVARPFFEDVMGKKVAWVSESQIIIISDLDLGGKNDSDLAIQVARKGAPYMVEHIQPAEIWIENGTLTATTVIFNGVYPTAGAYCSLDVSDITNPDNPVKILKDDKIGNGAGGIWFKLTNDYSGTLTFIAVKPGRNYRACVKTYRPEYGDYYWSNQVEFFMLGGTSTPSGNYGVYEEWILKQNGKGFRIGASTTECVGFVNAYLDHFWGFDTRSYKVNSAYQIPGNMKDVFEKHGFQLIKYTQGFIPQPGDIAIWGQNWYPGSKHGHVGLVVAGSNTDKVVVYDQFNSRGCVGQSTYTHKDRKNFWGVIRPPSR